MRTSSGRESAHSKPRRSRTHIDRRAPQPTQIGRSRGLGGRRERPPRNRLRERRLATTRRWICRRRSASPSAAANRGIATLTSDMKKMLAGIQIVNATRIPAAVLAGSSRLAAAYSRERRPLPARNSTVVVALSDLTLGSRKGPDLMLLPRTGSQRGADAATPKSQRAGNDALGRAAIQKTAAAAKKEPVHVQSMAAAFQGC